MDRHFRGPLGAPTSTKAGDGLAIFGSEGFIAGYGIPSSLSAYITMYAAEDWVSTPSVKAGALMTFNVTPIGGTAAQEAMRINASGGVSLNSVGDPGLGNLMTTNCFITTGLNCQMSTTNFPQWNMTNTANHNGSNYLPFFKSRNNANTLDNDLIVNILFNGYGNAGYRNSAGIGVFQDGAVSGSNVPGKIQLATTSSTGTTTSLVFGAQGHLNAVQTTVPTLTAGCNGAGSGALGVNTSDMMGAMQGQTAAATTCTLTFNKTWTGRPYCNVTGEQSQPLTVVPSTTTLVITFASTA